MEVRAPKQIDRSSAQASFDEDQSRDGERDPLRDSPLPSSRAEQGVRNPRLMPGLERLLRGFRVQLNCCYFLVPIRWRLSWSRRFQLLSTEAIAAVYRPVAFWLERNPGGGATFGTINFCRAARILSIALHTHEDATIWASFGLVDQSFSAEKFLFARRKHK